MKKQNDTWLGFFKKTLKVSGIIVLLFIVSIIVTIYISYRNNSYTYLSCIEKGDDKINYFAFNNSRLLQNWDSIEGEFKQNLKIIEFSKRKIKAVFYFAKNYQGGPITIEETKPYGAVDILEGYISFNRETGEYSLSFEDRGMVGNKEDCTKINKKDLPIKKINQKF